MSAWFAWPELLAHVAAFRYGLLLLALFWALTVLRSSRAAALGAGVLFVEAALGLSVLSLARPYGLLQDPAATGRVAEAAVAAASGDGLRSFVAGAPVAFPAYVRLARIGVPGGVLRTLPSLLPALVLPTLGLAVFLLWRRRAEALTGACLVLAFATGALESQRGLGFVPGIWARPEAALALPFLAGLALVVGRVPWRLAAVAASLPVLAAVVLPVPQSGLSKGDAILALTLDQGPWLVLGLLGLVRARDAASLGLIAGGALGVLASALGSWSDGWSSLALYRLGLLSSAAAASGEWLQPLGIWARRWAGSPLASAVARADRVGLALLLSVALPGSFLSWWDPFRTDAVARESLEPISPVMAPPMAFIAHQTPPAAVFLASPDYAPAVAAFGGRRVLRAPSLRVTADDTRRQRAEGAILAGRPIPPGGDDHGVRFVFIAPGDFKARGIARPEDLEERPGFRLRYGDPAGFRVYELVR